MLDAQFCYFYVLNTAYAKIRLQYLNYLLHFMWGNCLVTLEAVKVKLLQFRHIIECSRIIMHEVIAENTCNAMKQKVYARRRKCQSFYPVPKNPSSARFHYCNANHQQQSDESCASLQYMIISLEFYGCSVESSRDKQENEN
jgi:hypothetical protein